jgi:branched-chain amino acid aminotransferase
VIICLNGKFVAESQAKISVFDHGLLYGDGVFDTILAVNGQIFWLDEHIDRLLDGCERIRLQIPWKKQELIALATETFQRNGGDTGRIRITITRGEGGIPIHDSPNCKPNLIIFSTQLEFYPQFLYEKGIKLAITRHQRVYPRVKSLSFIPSVLGYLEGLEIGADEALFVNQDGNILEGSTFNIFVVNDGRIRTPQDQILVGITRNKVIELSFRIGLKVEEANIPLMDALSADEVFLTGTTKKILPVSHIDEAVINMGKIGEITRKLMVAFSEYYF